MQIVKQVWDSECFLCYIERWLEFDVQVYRQFKPTSLGAQWWSSILFSRCGKLITRIGCIYTRYSSKLLSPLVLICKTNGTQYILNGWYAFGFIRPMYTVRHETFPLVVVMPHSDIVDKLPSKTYFVQVKVIWCVLIWISLRWSYMSKSYNIWA